MYEQNFYTRTHLELIALDWENEAEEELENHGVTPWYRICMDEAVRIAEALQK